MKTPSVSVLMTAYNRSSYIGAAIESVLKQTFSDFELIIVDDSSSDGTFETAQAYTKDHRVKVYKNETNLGDYPNRNHAAKLAQGEFIKYHDSDDVLYPYCLEVMVKALRANPEAGFGLTRGRAWEGAPSPMLSTPRMSYQREFFGFGMFMCSPSGALFRTHVLKQLDYFPLHGAASDYFFWLKACARHNCLLFPADLFWYREHSGQEIQSSKAALDYANTSKGAWEALQKIDCPLSAEEKIQAENNLIFEVVKNIILDGAKGNFKLALYRLRSMNLIRYQWLRLFRRKKRQSFAGSSFDSSGNFKISDQSYF